MSRGGTIAKAAAMVVLGLGVPAAGLAVAWKSCRQGTVQGRVDVTGSTLGAWQAALGRCTSGQARGFRGVELSRGGDDRPLVRLVMDPLDGPLLTLWPLSGDRTLELRARDCPALTAELRSAGGGGDDGDDERFDGTLRGTCPLRGGGSARFDVWWRGC